MSVSLEEVLNHAGYDPLHDIDDARWLLASKEEFEELVNKATDLQDDYDEYEWEMQEMEDAGDFSHKITFKEWLKNKWDKKMQRDREWLKNKQK